MKIKVVLFDLDGTLLDTDAVIFASFFHVFQRHFPGRVFTDEEKMSWLGPSLKETFSRYVPAEKVGLLIEEYREHNIVNQKNYVTIFPTVESTLSWLKCHGYSLGIVTSKTVHSAKVGLDLFHLIPYFDVFIGFDEVKEHKPSPEGILKALQFYNVRPEEAIMVGDSTTDLLAAKNAGVGDIAIGWSRKGVEHLLELNPLRILNQMDDLIHYLQDINNDPKKND